MAIQTLYATSLVSGTAASAANALGQPNGTWTTDTGNTNWTARWAIGDPVNVLSANGTHSFVARVRKEVGQSGNPTAQLIVYSGGTQIGSSATTNITGTTDLTVSVAAANITNLTNVDIELVTISASGSPNTRSAVQVDALWWTGDFTPVSPPVAISASDTSSISIADSGSWEEYVPPDDPTLLYEVSFDEVVGSTAASSGIIQSLSPIPSWAAIGKNGAAMEVDPIQGHAPPQTASSTTNPLPEYTIMAWWKVDDAGISGNALFAAGNIGNLTVDNFGELAWAQNFQTIFAENPLSTGTYYHVAITGSPTSRELFVNGVSVGTLNTPALTYQGNMTVGGSSSTNGANHVDDFRLYSRVLTPSEIQSAMNTAVTLPEQEQPDGIHVVSSSIEELSSGTSISVPKPVIVADGDVLFASIHFTGSALPTTVPSGFQLYGSVIPSSVVGVAVYYKVVSSAASEPSNYIWSGIGSGRITGIITSYRGVDNANPLDVATMQSAENQSSSSVIVPGITTITDGAALVGAAVQNNSTGSITEPSGWTRTAHSSGGLGRTGAAGYFIQSAAGNIGTQTWTFESTTLAHGAVVGALRPVGDSGETTEQIAGTDTSSISVVESASLVISRTVSSSDTSSISVVESNARFVTKSAADAASITLTETASASKNLPGAETIALGLAEQAQISVVVNRSDASALSVAESRITTKALSSTDTASLSAAETTARFITKSASDNHSLRITETANAGKNLPGNETIVLGAVEQAQIFKTSSASDTAAIAATESRLVEGLKVFGRTDTSGLAITESTSIEKRRTVTDTSALSASESRTLDKFSTITDNNVLSVVESAQIFVTQSAADESTITVSDHVFSGNDSQASDSDTLAISEDAAVAKSISATDSSVITVSDDTVVTKALSANDQSVIAVNEVTSAAGTAPGIETVAIGLTEQVSIYITSTTTDTTALGSTDIAGITLTAPQETTDSGALAVAESSSIAKAIGSTDTSVIGVTEDATSFVTVATADTSALSGAESRETFATRTRTDLDGLSVSESSQTFVEVESSDHSAVRVVYPKWPEDPDYTPGDGGAENTVNTSSTDNLHMSVQEAAVVVGTEATTTLYVYTNGEWKQGQMFIFINGEWRQTTYHVRTSGTWL